MKNIQLRRALPFIVLASVVLAGILLPVSSFYPDSGYVPADIGWMMISTALVFLMTPGLAFFYGGMVNRKNVISTMIKSVVAAGVTTVLWIAVGFSMAFGDSINGLIGDPGTFIFFSNVPSSAPWSLAPTIPLTLFATFQLMFAIITPGLVVGAVAERIRFTSYILFIALFGLLVYLPLAHWTWHPDGFLLKMGIFDFAGGTVVHISAGCAALAGAMVLKPRLVHRERQSVPPANIPYVLIGTGLLWFGWFGFNAGSALGANTLAVSAFACTNASAASAGLAWLFFDVLKGKKPSVLGFCIGAVVGLVAITPAAGYVAIHHSLFIGFVAAIISNIAVSIRSRTTLDDTLDVFPCHGVGGITGMLLTGIFASQTVNPAGPQGLYFGDAGFFSVQVQGALIVVAYSFLVSWGIFKVINFIEPLRVTSQEEEVGLDESQHNEKYLQGTLVVKQNGEMVDELKPL
jgi:ammonium transporter, Amt family